MQDAYFRYLPMLGRKKAQKEEHILIQLRNVLQVQHNAYRVSDKQKNAAQPAEGGI